MPALPRVVRKVRLESLGESHNNQHLVIMMANDEPMPAYEKAAETMAIAALLRRNSSTRLVRFRTCNTRVCLAPAAADKFTNQERNLLLFDGIATEQGQQRRHHGR